ncbi:hypothetical protein ACP_1896 [Acidobacterium capsulatum ATCC 51196]|uniref:Uncharacterized protein n=1 Tax=Acidobacterium capsulatum (strain ATCC 51196 / DSM 11244 / BCRC 80197 / JCM 7670 / NBRC 15755 / NCIMB 13165 / 161) TaxID=240015 RepID=C1F887_ACIC5|nr:hypothetical protein ACP_1896 [Acidobacterium capsulatum ATCC 51196]
MDRAKTIAKTPQLKPAECYHRHITAKCYAGSKHYVSPFSPSTAIRSDLRK